MDESDRSCAAVNLSAQGDIEPVFDDILRLSEHPAPDVRLSVVAVLAGRDDENTANLLSARAQDPSDEVRQAALFSLRERT